MLWGVLKRWWWLAVVLVTASACQASFEVVVEVEEDGSGTVETTTTIAAEAADAVLDLDRGAGGIVLADLAQSGWVIERPDVAADGTTVIMATKEFGTPEQFSEIMDELAGEEGPFQDFALTRAKSFARVDYEFSGVLDTTGGLAVFGDPELEAALGESLTDLAERYGASADQVEISVQTSLPGELQGERPNLLLPSPEERVAARWQATLDEGRVEGLDLATATSNVSPLVLIGVAVVLGVLALLVLLAQILRILVPDRRRRHRGGRRRPPRAPAPTPAPPRTEPVTGQVPVVAADGSVESPCKVVAFDLMGVLYRPANHVEELLIPFVRERSTASITDEEIAARARALVQGRITTDGFWAAVGVRGDPARHDAEYVARHQLAPGVIRYLRALRDSGVRVAVITNYASRWATALRAAHLEALVDPWVVSGAVGVRLPDPAMFEALRRLTGTDPAEIQIIDDDLGILDAARDLGFATSWFAPNGDRALAGDHAVLRTFGPGDDEPVDGAEAAARPRPDSD